MSSFYHRLYTLLLLSAFSLVSMAQSLEITKAFKMNEFSTVLTTYKNEFGHKIKQGVKDNAFPYAVIEVELVGDEHAVTTAKAKLSLDMGAQYMVEGVTKEYDNKIVFLVSSSVRTIYMTCGDGCEKQAIFEGMQLKPDRIYFGTVSYTPASAPVVATTQAPKRQFFSFNVTPSNAIVSVIENGEKKRWQLTDGVASNPLNHGRYSYSVSAQRYYTEDGVFTVSDTDREKIVILKPKFGWLTINGGSDLQGAHVYVTNTSTSEESYLGVVPIKAKDLDAGQYRLLIQKDKYKDYTNVVTVTENQTNSLKPSLVPNFAELTLTTLDGADIIIDEQRIGTGTWSGTLEFGEYSVECRKASHKSAYTKVVVTAQTTGKKIALNAPIPIYGSLMVQGTPAGASVYVDNQLKGKSPIIVNDLLIGSHKVRIEKDTYDKQEKTTQITEGQEEMLKYELVKIAPQPVMSDTKFSVDNSGKTNGHEYVDLGLSVMWATCNVGASKPEDYGDYFAWGETRTKDNYSTSNYSYKGTSATLPMSADAANANWGGSWRMPTKNETEELKNQCKWERINHNGVYGYKVISKINGNSIFLPAAGDYLSRITDTNKHGNYWTSTKASGGACELTTSPDYVIASYNSSYTHWGKSIRPVCPKTIRHDGDLQTSTPSNSSTASDGVKSGHEYVDLGLSVMWATCNVGASKPEDYGDYFAWGETKTKTTYEWDNYKWCRGDENSATKYCKNSKNGRVDNKTSLDLSDDAAYINWGGDWRMPTDEELRELHTDCNWQWTTQKGVYGYRVISKKNGNSIFLPAAGNHWKSSFLDAGKEGSYWSKTLAGGAIGGYILRFTSEGVSQSCVHAKDGLSVRPVCPKTIRHDGDLQTTTPSNSSTASTGVKSGHEYVDLGLSVKWATCNIGARRPEDFGDYFAWGETDKKSDYGYNSYKYFHNGDYESLTKYNSERKYGYKGFVDNKTTLEPSDDAAVKQWGGRWRMPTKAEMNELLDNCRLSMTKQNGVYGYRLTSKINGKSIFLPAAGYYDYSGCKKSGREGFYLTSSVGNIYCACIMLPTVENDRLFIYSYGSRQEGCSVRPVCP